MSVCVRISTDVAEFHDVAETAELLRMIGAVEASVPQVTQASTDLAHEASAQLGVATDSGLAQLQARADQAAAAGCR